jgi:hypothetical protein
MKTKTAVSTKKQSVAVRDLKTTKNPKGGLQAAQNLPPATKSRPPSYWMLSPYRR